MRDILVTLIVFGSLPFILKKPYIGVLMWVWMSVMNPHTQGWGFATDFPFAAIIAAVTLMSLVATKEEKALPRNPVVWALLAFTLWMCVTTVFAFEPLYSMDMLKRVIKIMLMTFVALMLIKTKRQIQLFICILVFSLGFYGVKGGIFTVASGGAYRVWGPDNTFIGGNNEIALALIVVIPMMHYLQTISENKWVRHGLSVSMLLCALASLGSYSRGALVAMAAMGGFLWIKSKHKARIGLMLIVAAPALVMFMPDQWTERMDTIQTYQEDSSAMGRINAWHMAFNLAKDRPLVGGGFDIYDATTFASYAPNPLDIHAAHSIYFQVLGEHGFVGLFLYLLVVLLTWRTGSWIIRNTAKLDEYKWAASLATMIQVSMLGFGVGGAFLSLLYFDVPYYLLVVMVATRALVEKELKQKAALASPQQYAAPGLVSGGTASSQSLTKNSG